MDNNTIINNNIRINHVSHTQNCKSIFAPPCMSNINQGRNFSKYGLSISHILLLCVVLYFTGLLSNFALVADK